jgi:general transcriptional corepressor TUP1
MKRSECVITFHGFIVHIPIGLQIWDIKAGTICRVFEHKLGVYSVEFSRDGRLIVSGGWDWTVRIWNMDDGNSKVLTIDGRDHDGGITCAAFSPNGQLVAASSLNSNVYIWDVETGNRLETLRGHRDSVFSIAFTPDGKQLVSGSFDKTLKYWDVTGLMSGIRGREDANGRSTNGPGELANRKNDNDTQCTMDLTGHKVWPSGLFFLFLLPSC